MIGTVIFLALVATCFAEMLAQGRPHRAAQLKNLRVLVVMAWAGWQAQRIWNDVSAMVWLVFDDPFGARLFAVAFFGSILWLAAAVLLESKWAAFRAAFLTGNAIVSAVFALILGATVDWASSPMAVGVAVVAIAGFATITWQVINGQRKTHDHAECVEAQS